MTPEAIIRAKRDGRELERGEIEGFIRSFLDWDVSSYQMSAFLMAVYFRGMTPRETADLTRVMMESGEPLTFPGVRGPKIDKHSTGGVGDWISLPLAPLVACSGVAVPMVAGRGLGHTGGTIDKLESIPGFRADLDAASFRAQIASVGCAIAEQTLALAPADKRMYALRDVTATVESIPLIVSSILSKKGAEGIDGLVLDVKCGRGAFMKTEKDALELAAALVEVGELLGIRTAAFVTDMDLPLGPAVGNALEVRAAVDLLSGRGTADVLELVLTEGAAMLALGHPGTSFQENRERIAGAIADGSGLKRFRRMIAAQGGDIAALEGQAPAPHSVEVPAPAEGWVTDLDPVSLGRAGVELGGGRRQVEDDIDPAVGISLARTFGDRVMRGETVATIWCRNPRDGERVARELVAPALRVAPARPERPPLIRHVVTAAGSRAWRGESSWDEALNATPPSRNPEPVRSGPREGGR